MEKAFKYRLYQSSIYNLATSLSQGSGLGTSVSLVDMVKSLAVKKGNVYEVDCELLDLLFDNNHFSRSILNGLQNVVKLFDESVELEKIDASEIYDEFPELLKDLEQSFESRNLKLRFENRDTKGTISVNPSKLFIAVEEIVINSLKFGKTGTEIIIEDFIKEGSYHILVSNEIDSSLYEGITPEKESLVIEPFYRIQPPADEHLRVSRFGLGLGLTMISYIVDCFGGEFRIQNQKKGDKVTVSAEICIPLCG